jgi:hypothetical protein
MIFDDIDMKILKENFDESVINELDSENVMEIYNYLLNNGIYYAKDLFISSTDLFLLSFEEFKMRFEQLKNKLGSDYVDKLGENSALIEIMYQ